MVNTPCLFSKGSLLGALELSLAEGLSVADVRAVGVVAEAAVEDWGTLVTVDHSLFR